MFFDIIVTMVSTIHSLEVWVILVHVLMKFI